MKQCPNCNGLIGDSADGCFNCHYSFALGRVITGEENIKKEKYEMKYYKQNQNLLQHSNKTKRNNYYYTTFKRRMYIFKESLEDKFMLFESTSTLINFVTTDIIESKKNRRR